MNLCRRELVILLFNSEQVSFQNNPFILSELVNYVIQQSNLRIILFN